MHLAVGRSHRLSSTTDHKAGVMRQLESGVRGHVLFAADLVRQDGARGTAAPPPVSVVPESSFIQGGSLPSQGATRQAVTGDVT
jgi:hypothetical protein